MFAIIERIIIVKYITKSIKLIFFTLHNTMELLIATEKAHTGLKRDESDKFYTKREVAEQCVKLLQETINIKKNVLIIEPSAGNGSFIEFLSKLPGTKEFYDLYPSHPSVIKQDYYTFDTEYTKSYEQVIVVGNPPFGRQSTHTHKFIKKSCSYCDVVAFIVPRSFKKESMRSRVPRNFHLVKECDLPDDSFTINGEDHKVPCMFQIWKKESHLREKFAKYKEEGYEFVKKSEHPTIAIRRVGVYAGKVFTESYDKSEQSHYFMKIPDFTFSLFEQLQQVKFDASNHTVGPKSISKQELIQEYNKIIPK